MIRARYRKPRARFRQTRAFLVVILSKISPNPVQSCDNMPVLRAEENNAAFTPCSLMMLYISSLVQCVAQRFRNGCAPNVSRFGLSGPMLGCCSGEAALMCSLAHRKGAAFSFSQAYYVSQADLFNRASSTSNGKPGSSFAQRITRLVFTDATLSAEVSPSVRKF
jgi:hypothetical protein